MNPKRILICDDHKLLADGLRELLMKEDLDVTTVYSFEECVNVLQVQTFDVFFCDLNIAGRNGLDLIQENRSLLQGMSTFMLTAFHEEYLEQQAMKLKIQGFLSKETDISELLTIIKDGDVNSFYSQRKKPLRLEGALQNPEKSFRLSAQEREIIKLIVHGKTSREIAEKLYISKNTVDTHRKNINKKLGITNVGSLIRFANENGLG